MCLLALRRVSAAAADRDEFIVTVSANGGRTDGACVSRSQLFRQTDVFGVGGCLRQTITTRSFVIACAAYQLGASLSCRVVDCGVESTA